MKIFKPLDWSLISKPDKAVEILSLVVWYFFSTDIPYPSSQTDITSGISKTQAAFMDSQKTPSEVLASPIVPKATSFPLFEKLLKSFNSLFCL